MQKSQRATDVAVFLAVVRRRSFTGAARDLRLSIATISRRVVDLEERLGVQLLTRTTRRLAPTQEGLRFAHRAGQALQELDEAEAEARGASETPRGMLRVAAPPELAHVVLGGPVQHLLETWPNLAIEVHLSHRNVDLVAEGYDVALRFNVPPDSTLIGRKLGEVTLAAMASPSYLARRGAPATPAALRKHEILGLSAVTHRHRVDFKSSPARRARVDLQARFFANSFEVLRELAVRGLGIALLPQIITAPQVARGELSRVLPRWWVAGAVLHVVYPRRRLLPAKTRIFVAALEKIGGAAWAGGPTTLGSP